MSPSSERGRAESKKQMKHQELAGYSALTLAAILWGGSIVGQKIALGFFSVVETSLLRGVGALLILIPLWWWQEGSRVHFSARDRMIILFLGLGVLGNHLLTLFGLRYVSAAAAGVIIGASPALTALLSSLLIRDVPFRTVAGGCVLSFGGVALVSGFGSEAPTGSHPWLGGMLVLLGLVSWALYTIGGRRIMDTVVAADRQLDNPGDISALPISPAMDGSKNVSYGGGGHSPTRLACIGVSGSVCDCNRPASMAVWSAGRGTIKSRRVREPDSGFRSFAFRCRIRGDNRTQGGGGDCAHPRWRLARGLAIFATQVDWLAVTRSFARNLAAPVRCSRCPSFWRKIGR